MPVHRERYGPWALVTGASSGIGRAFAERLASEGLSIVLASRREPVLKDLGAELTERHGVDTRAVGVDLAIAGSVDELLAAVEDLEIGLVVSNAGTGIPGFFGDCDLAAERSLVQLNCVASLDLARRALPAMERRGRGGLILVASMMGFHGVPQMAHYSATKAYLLNLGESLYHEYRDRGVDVLALAPGGTETPGKYLHDVDYDKLPLHFHSPDFVVDCALRALGKRPLVVPGLRNHLIACLSSGLWTRRFVQHIMHRLARLALKPKSPA